MIKYILGSLFAVGVLSASAGLVTQALFTDTASVSSSTFTAGTLNIHTGTTSTTLSLANKAPGDITTGAVTINNGGTLQLGYDLAAAVTDTDGYLSPKLKLRVAIRDAQGNATSPSGTCDTFFNNVSPNTLTTPTVAATPDVLVVNQTGISTGKLIGNVTSSTTGRILDASKQEVLCFAVVFPLETTTQPTAETTASITFTVNAVQTANNPISTPTPLP